MMSDFLYSFVSCCIYYSFQRDIFIPSAFALFYTVANKHKENGVDISWASKQGGRASTAAALPAASAPSSA
jgi:hypothetical protein